MKKLIVVTMALAVAALFSAINASAEDKVVFGFEKDTQGFEIPEWALEQEDHVAKSIEVSDEVAKEGKKSLKMMANFPGKTWTAALVEDFEYFDWTPYKEVSVDIYIPAEAPVGLKGKIILTYGENWKWTEMSRGIDIAPGEWLTITANLLPGSEDW